MCIKTDAISPTRRLLHLLLCAGIFFAGYNLTNWAAAQHAQVGSIVFAWERQIPFLPWTIIPYWSIDLLYGIAFLLCVDRAELNRHTSRILTAQAIAFLCFLAFPLRLAFDKPPTDGVFGALFALLGSFDQPYNQLPSLHIALLVILWDLYARRLSRRFHPAIHLWALLIGASVLTTWQHHFIDVPTGVLLGLLCLWLWPEQGRSPLARLRLTHNRKRRRIAALYAAASLVLASGTLAGGWFLWLLWPAVSLALVAGSYAVLGPDGFQKRADGSMPFATRLLLLPYLIGARLNALLWTRGDPVSEIAPGVFLGRLPLWKFQTTALATIIDLCAELPAPRHDGRHITIPALDLIPLSEEQKQHAVDSIEAGRAEGPLLIACALGYGRGAEAAAAWLHATGRAASPVEARCMLRAARPRIALKDDQNSRGWSGDAAVRSPSQVKH
ncbi:MAG TPA: phosphatase PAP2/dual specificity phosphatase family protein [Candidatus Cybelea sp.]|nr:phosphatase PAP2/dual specificity phosphatase family protein [Candidatus Cybelea sp.]